jgi:hypothetical protein
LWIIGFSFAVILLIFAIVALQKSRRAPEIEREVVEVQQPLLTVQETPRVPTFDPAATKEWAGGRETPKRSISEKKREVKKEPEPRRAQTPKPPMVRSQKPAQKPLQKSPQNSTSSKVSAPIKKVGQQVKFSEVQVSNAPSKCSPCHIPARLSDGTKVLLVSPNERLWSSAGVKGNVRVSIKGLVMKIAGSESWILLQGVSTP